MHPFTWLFLALVLAGLAVRLWLAQRQIATVSARRDSVPPPFEQSWREDAPSTAACDVSRTAEGGRRRAAPALRIGLVCSPKRAQRAGRESTMKLENRAAVITGGASGIGAAIGKRFAEEGAAITLVDVDVSRGVPVPVRWSAAPAPGPFSDEPRSRTARRER